MVDVFEADAYLSAKPIGGKLAISDHPPDGIRTDTCAPSGFCDRNVAAGGFRA